MVLVRRPCRRTRTTKDFPPLSAGERGPGGEEDGIGKRCFRKIKFGMSHVCNSLWCYMETSAFFEATSPSFSISLGWSSSAIRAILRYCDTQRLSAASAAR